MTSLQSLGVHVPSGLQYLVSEQLLPEVAGVDAYTWLPYHNGEGDSQEEEILYTDKVVVYSKGSIVRKTFRFEAEKQAIVQALLTNFPKANLPRPRSKTTVDAAESGKARHDPGTPVESSNFASNQAPWGDARFARSYQTVATRALVVILRSQAHIFFLNGPSHVIHLPFEVQKAFEAPHGLIFQRAVIGNLNAGGTQVPQVPPNSFISSQFSHGSAFPLMNSFLDASKSLVSHDQKFIPPGLFDDLKKSTVSETSADLPRHFSLIDPFSEMGLVVSSSDLYRQKVQSNSASSIANLEPLDKAEDVIYVSNCNEAGSSPESLKSPLHIIVTANYSTQKYYIYYASYAEQVPIHKKLKHKKVSASIRRRRSSFNPVTGTGATTPAVKYGREGSASEVQSRDVSSSFQAAPRDVVGGLKATAEEILASQIDPEFNTTHAPDKSGRRVSSLISRADLSTSVDKHAFEDLATGHHGLNTHHVGAGRRGHSLGSVSDRASVGPPHITKTRKVSSTFRSFNHLTINHPSGPPNVDEIMDDDDTEDSNGSTGAKSSALGRKYRLTSDLGLPQPADRLRNELFVTRIEECNINDAGSVAFSRSISSIDLSKSVRVFVTASPLAGCTIDNSERMYNVNIVDVDCSIYTEVGLAFRHVKSPRKTSSIDSSKTINHRPLEVFCTGVKRLEGYPYACKLTDGKVDRSLLLRTTGNGSYEVTLYCGWSNETVLHLPLDHFRMYNPYQMMSSSSASRGNIGLKRLLEPPKSIIGLRDHGSHGRFSIDDSEGVRHTFQLSLQPKNELTSRSLDICRFILTGFAGESFVTTWWMVIKDIRLNTSYNAEWTALVVSIFALGIPLLSRDANPLSVQSKKTPFSRRLPQTFGNAALSTENVSESTSEVWHSLWRHETINDCPKSWRGNAWSMVLENDGKAPLSGPVLKSDTSKNLPETDVSDFITHCVALTEVAMSQPGISSAVKRIDLQQGNAGLALVKVAIALHLMYEELKLNTLTSGRSGYLYNLGPVLAQVCSWLGWIGWGAEAGGYYDLNGAGVSRFRMDERHIPSTAGLPPKPWSEPPSVLSWIENCVINRPNSGSFPTLMLFAKDEGVSESSSPVWPKDITDLTPRTITIVKYLTSSSKRAVSGASMLEHMEACGIEGRFIETLPEAVAALFQDPVIKCHGAPSKNWNDALLRLVRRHDLLADVKQAEETDHIRDLPEATNHLGPRDIHFICETADQPVVYPYSPALDKSTIVKLLFDQDQRHTEASKLLHTLRPAVAECTPDSTWSESDYLEAQKEVMQWVMIRTFSLPAGQAMMNFDSRKPLLTEKFPLHGFTAVCLMKPLNNTVSADRSTFTEEKFCWAFFHAGVSSGLAISPKTDGIDTSWIVFNKPNNPSNKHAGLLLALGLNGHLRSIAKWLAFKYLTPKHTMTSIGFLLGLSASYIGSMDTLITRLLSVHITRMLPVGAAELNLSPLTQTTGLMGIGLLYARTQHRRMTEVMLAEIEDISMEDGNAFSNNFRDESYRLAAGFACGLINLSKGQDLRGLHDLRPVERLLAVAVGSRTVDMVHIIDQATAGATIAIALMFLQTNNQSIARKIDVPDTLPQFDYVRPDIFLLRTVAKHLIMWDHIRADDAWILENLPSFYRSYSRLQTINKLRSTMMPFYNILTGLLWSIALRYSGTGDGNVRDFLLKYMDQFIRLCSIPAVQYDTKLTSNTIRNCQDLLALSVATVMAGTGDLDVFRRLRLLHGRVGPETPYGSHLAAHMALGALFLGGGCYTFDRSPLAIAALLCAFYPLFPTDVLDNKAHLQAFRHLWVLAVSPRCLIVRDVESGQIVQTPVKLTVSDQLADRSSARKNTGRSRTLDRSAPCLLPPLESILSLQVLSPAHWPVTLELTGTDRRATAFRQTQTIPIQRRPGRAAYPSVFAAELAARAGSAVSARHTATGSRIKPTHGTLSPGKTPRGSWRWISQLPFFASSFDSTDWTLVLPTDTTDAASSFPKSHPASVATVAAAAAENAAGAGFAAHGARSIFAQSLTGAGTTADMPAIGASAGNGSLGFTGAAAATAAAAAAFSSSLSSATHSPSALRSGTAMDMACSEVDHRLSLLRAADGWDRDGLLGLRLLFQWADKVVEDDGTVAWLGSEAIDALRAKINGRSASL